MNSTKTLSNFIALCCEDILSLSKQRQGIIIAALLLAAQILGVTGNHDNFTLEGNLLNNIDLIPELELNHNDLKILSESVDVWSYTLVDDRNGTKYIKENNEHPQLNNVFENITVVLGQSEMEEHKKILEQFDRIDSDLQSLGKLYDRKENERYFNHPGLSRKARSPLGRRLTCTLSKDKLIDLKNIVQDVLSKSITTQTENTCELDSLGSNNCEELIELIQCGVTQLKNGFIKATVNKATLAEVAKLENAYKDFLERYQKEIDNVKESISEKYQRKIDEQLNDIQELMRSSNALKEQLKEQRKALCISEISSGKIAKAIIQYKQLNDYGNYDDLANLISEAYVDYGKLENFDNIMEFIWNLPWLAHRVVSFKQLVEDMQRYGHLDNPKVLILAAKIQETIDKPNKPEVKKESEPDLLALKNKLAVHVNNVIDSWTNKVQNNDYKDITEFDRKYSISFRAQLKQLIQKSTNSGNIQKILTFIRNLPYIEDGIIGLTSLFEKMKYNNQLDSYELVMLVYRVKEYGDMDNFFKVSEIHKKMYQDLKNNLPSSVRNLIWNESCRVKNRGWNEYLFSSDDSYDSDRRHIFTRNFPESRWKFVTADNAVSFKIKDSYLNEYMYAASDYFNYNEDRRRVFTWKSGESVAQGYWKLKPVDNCRYFTILNTVHGEYLYADGQFTYSSIYRRVFTWRPGNPQGVMIHESHWDIDCF